MGRYDVADGALCVLKRRPHQFQYHKMRHWNYPSNTLIKYHRKLDKRLKRECRITIRVTNTPSPVLALAALPHRRHRPLSLPLSNPVGYPSNRTLQNCCLLYVLHFANFSSTGAGLCLHCRNAARTEVIQDLFDLFYGVAGCEGRRKLKGFCFNAIIVICTIGLSVYYHTLEE